MVSLLIKYFTADSSLTPSGIRVRYGFICGGCGIFFNLILFTAKLITGLRSGFVSITADAFNNLFDAAACAVTLFGFVLAGRKADKKHPFGHGRAEYIAGLMISVIIILAGFELFQTSCGKIINPSGISFNKTAAVVLVLSVFVKLYMAYYNRVCADKIHSETLRAASNDSISDCLATGAVLLSFVFMRVSSVDIDGYAGAVVSLFIMTTGIKSILETAGPLLGNAPDAAFVEKIERIVRQNPETIGIHDLIVHNYGPNKVFVTLHMEVDGTKDLFVLHDAADVTERRISEELLCDAVIHMDPIDTKNPVRAKLLIKLSDIVSKIDSSVTIHDFRMVSGPTHTNLIFDILLNSKLYQNREKIISEIKKEIKNMDESYFAIIKADVSYD